MILYFSATGNTKLVAELLGDKLQDTLVSLNQVLKEGTPWRFHSDKPFVLVAPIYAWRLPAVIEKLLGEASFSGDKRLYVVATMGQSCGAAGDYCRAIAQARGLMFQGLRGIVMPDNFVVGFPAVSREEAVEVIRQALPEVDKVGEAVAAGRPLSMEKAGLLGRLESGVAHWGFQRFMANSRSFTVDPRCTACGKCVRICPVNNIRLEKGTISFGQNCMFCLGCINQCPTHAIDRKGKGAKNGHYTCPSLEELFPAGSPFH